MFLTVIDVERIYWLYHPLFLMIEWLNKIDNDICRDLKVPLLISPKESVLKSSYNFSSIFFSLSLSLPLSLSPPLSLFFNLTNDFVQNKENVYFH